MLEDLQERMILFEILPRRMFGNCKDRICKSLIFDVQLCHEICGATDYYDISDASTLVAKTDFADCFECAVLNTAWLARTRLH